MFYSTLRKLTVVNSVVFLIIFITFGATLYGYVAWRLFDKVDDAMRATAGALTIVNGRISVTRRPQFDPRTFLLLRDEDGRIFNLFPFKTEESKDIVKLVSHIGKGDIQTKSYEDHFYRIIVVPYQQGENSLRTEDDVFIVKDVITVSIVDSEIGLLKNLLLIIIGELIISLIAIIIAGYFLARRAMIPIQASWEKQQQFVADASHELRSPLTIIKSNAELMLRHPERIVQEESPRVTNIIREAMRMTKLINSLLTLARADANQAELQLVVVRLNGIIESVIEQFKPLARLNGINLDVNMIDEIELLADKERVHQLLVILLDNALKYTPAGGRISISCLKNDGRIIISVADNGCGIPQQDLPRIFARFFRSDKARSRDNGGTGLGLAIAKWIADKHNGQIEVESTVGEGSIFRVIFPLKEI